MMSERSNSSGSISHSRKVSASSNNLSVSNSNASNNNQGIATCDSSSEVSDEGYKSSQGTLRTSSSGEQQQQHPKNQLGQPEREKSAHKLFFPSSQRPESSLTAVSDCSSTMSSSTEDGDAKLLEKNDSESPRSNISEEELEEGAVKSKEIPTVSNTTSARLSNIFQNMKIPKFKRQTSGGSAKSYSPTSDSSGSSTNGPPSPTRSLASGSVTPSAARKPPMRSRSIGGEDENSLNSFVRNTSERHSYRTPSASSRYMQAAEAYAARGRNARSKSSMSQHDSSWGGGASRPSSRASSNGSGYRRVGGRTTSASPGPQRRARLPERSAQNKNNTLNCPPLPPSSKSTPTKKKQPSSSSTASPQSQEEDDDGLILKRMEEILMTYKSKVEDHLAAEGRELPKDIFEDFTTQWVNEASSLTKSPSSRSSSRTRNPVTSTPQVRTTPTWRKEHRSGQKETKIPVPTFYNCSPIPSETRI